MAFVVHAQLFTCSYWDLSVLKAHQYLSISYWFKNAPDFSESLILLNLGRCLAVTGILTLGLGFKSVKSFSRIEDQKVDKLIFKGI